MAEMGAARHRPAVEALTRSVLEGEAETPRSLRAAVAGRGGEIPAPLAAYIAQVRDRAYQITTADIAALKQSGQSEEAIFELTVSTALGAGLYRLERAMAAVRAAAERKKP
jgi:hypothetical protein